jgi:hypothetical protein
MQIPTAVKTQGTGVHHDMPARIAHLGAALQVLSIPLRSAQRFADKLRAGRRVAPSMLHQCPCGRIDSFIGLLDGRTPMLDDVLKRWDSFSEPRLVGMAIT